MQNWKTFVFFSLIACLPFFPNEAPPPHSSCFSKLWAQQEWICSPQLLSSPRYFYLEPLFRESQAYIICKRGIWWCLLLNLYWNSFCHWSFIPLCCSVTTLCPQTPQSLLDTWLETQKHISCSGHSTWGVQRADECGERSHVMTEHRPLQPWGRGSLGVGRAREKTRCWEQWKLAIIRSGTCIF